jgi:hypothetical protein
MLEENDWRIYFFSFRLQTPFSLTVQSIPAEIHLTKTGMWHDETLNRKEQER